MPTKNPFVPLTEGSNMTTQRIIHGIILAAAGLAMAGTASAADSAKVLSGLVCPQGQIAKNDGSQWVCADDENDDTLGALACAEGEVAKFIGGAWTCAADEDTPNTDTLAELACAGGEIAKFDGSAWVCAADDDTPNTDTLAELDCTTDQIAAFNGVEWECATQPNQSNLVFLSSRAYAGQDLGGIIGADAKCNELANAAGLYGRFMAWLSDGKRPLPAPNQLQDLDLDVAQFDFATSPVGRFNRSPYPYVRTDGTKVADDWYDLTTCNEGAGGDQCLDAAIVLDETGARVPGTESGSVLAVWSSTGPDGSIGVLGLDQTLETCNDWEPELDLGDANLTPFGLAGDDVLDADWTNTTTGNPCNIEQRLYCFQQ
jgi:hypothetical protein